MQIHYHPYQLKPLQSLNSKSLAVLRQGCLLKVVWTEGVVGYADLHPWTELGDLDLASQLLSLKNQTPTELSLASLALSRQDAEARRRGKSLFPTDFKIRNNHLLLSMEGLSEVFLQELSSQGFESVKIKMGRNLPLEKQQLQIFTDKDFRLRLDFNSSLGEIDYENFMAGLSIDIRNMIEYVEDPMAYNEKTWARVQRWAPLALDQELNRILADSEAKPCCEVLIIKPAKVDIAKVLIKARKFKNKMTITSYMDHPLGVMHAASVAANMAREYPEMILDSGCLTHFSYVPCEFSRNMRSQGAFLYSAGGKGVGFDSLLEDLPWQDLLLQ